MCLQNSVTARNLQSLQFAKSVLQILYRTDIIGSSTKSRSKLISEFAKTNLIKIELIDF